MDIKYHYETQFLDWHQTENLKLENNVKNLSPKLNKS
jgi:hypothetical protein